MTGTRTAGPPRHLKRSRQPAATGLPHVPGLDGLRGLAVIGVLLFHADRLGGGFLGVDLFFVLSGFLITMLLLAEWETEGGLDLRRFWSRRARRLVPAMVVVVAACCAYAAWRLDPEALHRFRGDALATLADVANWREIATGTDYWRSTSAPSPLRHTWSLAIEEQLYLLWPVVVLAALRAGERWRVGRRVLGLTAVALAGASVLAMRSAVGGGDTTRAYYGTDTRASAVLVGGLAAVLLSTGDERVARTTRTLLGGLALPAALCIGAGWVLADGQDRSTYLWVLPVMSLLAAVVVGAVAVGRAGPLTPALEHPWLQALGRISYGTYLWHWPAYLVLDDDIGVHGWALTGLRLAVSVALGALSYELVERPVRRGRVGTSAWRVLGIGGVALTVGLVLLVTRGAEAPPEEVDGAVQSGLTSPPGTEPRLLLLGDSQAFRLGELGPDVLGDGVELGQYALLGCGIGPGLPVVDGVVTDRDLAGVDCREAEVRFRTAIGVQQPDLVILHVGAWEVLDRRIDGRDIAFGTPSWDEVTRTNLRAVLGDLAGRAQRVVVLAAPCFDPRGLDGGPAARGDDRRVARWNELLRSVAPEVGVEVAPLDQLFCGTGEEPPRRDGVHLAPAGAVEVWRWLIPQLRLDELVEGRAGSRAP